MTWKLWPPGKTMLYDIKDHYIGTMHKVAKGWLALDVNDYEIGIYPTPEDAAAAVRMKLCGCQTMCRECLMEDV